MVHQRPVELGQLVDCLITHESFSYEEDQVWCIHTDQLWKGRTEHPVVTTGNAVHADMLTSYDSDTTVIRSTEFYIQSVVKCCQPPTPYSVYKDIANKLSYKSAPPLSNVIMLTNSQSKALCNQASLYVICHPPWQGLS